MILKKIKKLLLKQGYDETKVDDLLKELENETDDEVDETESKEVVEEVKEKEVEETKEEQPIKEEEKETTTTQENEVKDVAEEVVDEKLDEKLPHDEHEEEVLEAKQDDTIKELAELVKGLTDRLDVLTTRTTELEKKLDTFGVVEEQAEIGLGSNQTPSGAKVSDALTDVLRALNNR